MPKLTISHYVERTKVLGPYERSALWVSGCCFSCEGCMAAFSDNIVTETEALSLAERLSEIDDAEGVTISGGEPFLQSEPLAEFIERIKEKRDYGAILYTGFTYEELTARGKNEPEIAKLLGMIDILIDGPYIASLDDGKAYRGSSNQRIMQLSGRYSRVFDEYYSSPKRRTEINFTRRATFLVGVPSKDGLAAWEEMRKTRGYLKHVK